MSMSPKQIVSELDRYIIGQSEAKRAVAIALRNRYRRSRLPEEIRQEITPKNIIIKAIKKANPSQEKMVMLKEKYIYTRKFLLGE